MSESEFRTHVSFRIMGESLDPTEITAAMGIDPSSGQWCLISPTGAAGFEVSDSNLSLLGQLGLPVGFDVYALG